MIDFSDRERRTADRIAWFAWGCIVGIVFCLLTGCQSTDAHVERALRIAEPIIMKAIEEIDLDAAQLTAGLQGINPAYRVEISGLVVTGFVGEAQIGFEGLSGQLSGSTMGRGPVVIEASP